jgi:protein CpxP
MKLTLISSLIFATLVVSPMVFSGGKHTDGMDGGQMMNRMPGSNNNQMMDADTAQHRMSDMTHMMNEAHDTKDMNKRHKLMEKHMYQMQNMMGSMNGMMGDNMLGNMNMEQGQEMMNDRMNMIQGMMEQMMNHQSMMMDLK